MDTLKQLGSHFRMIGGKVLLQTKDQDNIHMRSIRNSIIKIKGIVIDFEQAQKKEEGNFKLDTKLDDAYKDLLSDFLNNGEYDLFFKEKHLKTANISERLDAIMKFELDLPDNAIMMLQPKTNWGTRTLKYTFDYIKKEINNLRYKVSQEEFKTSMAKCLKENFSSEVGKWFKNIIFKH